MKSMYKASIKFKNDSINQRFRNLRKIKYKSLQLSLIKPFNIGFKYFSSITES